ncbi:uncharacterized protein MONBRDRAFT_26987 [Monosiga brevicollis MX1]|uniref:Tc1-like transposase DDE domain-containing protein n=1 Tax=Monosiga brevicollis TaxID=81824 RepID=A9V3I6_MONBE|nr:uncharacterized protein MONBRDRAFT_26987 [Monosiga brevicollis MX1]EDQ87919.1 predicted protein [Monosiga brevicollis MX1]|eukprot:XP_001747452.1 hypothetical protein [Monosiga brevicollis MX1]
MASVPMPPPVVGDDDTTVTVVPSTTSTTNAVAVSASAPPPAPPLATTTNSADTAAEQPAAVPNVAELPELAPSRSQLPLAPNAAAHPPAAHVPNVGHPSAAEGTGEPPAKRPLRTRDLLSDLEYRDLVTRVRKQRPRVLTTEERLDMVLLQAHLRHEAFKTQKASGGSTRRQKRKFAADVASMLHRSSNLCVQVWREFIDRGTVSPAPNQGPRGVKHTKVPHTKSLRFLLRDWLNERTNARERTVAKDVVAFLVQQKVLQPEAVASDRAARSTLRVVQLFIKALGFRRCKRAGKPMYRERDDVLRKRSVFLEKLQSYLHLAPVAPPEPTQEGIAQPPIAQAPVAPAPEASAAPPAMAPGPSPQVAPGSRRFVFVSENCIHHHFLGRGHRLCFSAAVISGQPGPSGMEVDAEHAQLLRDTVEIFEDNSPVDFHRAFSGAYFSQWMGKLLDSLQRRCITNAVIVMDETPYHKARPMNEPKRTWPKADLQRACEARGLPCGDTLTKDMLWRHLQDALHEDGKPVAVMMAEQAGHQVLFTPPHYSELQPMEMIWTAVKREVGLQHRTDTTFVEVRERLEHALSAVESKYVAEAIDKTIAVAQAMLDRERQIDAEEDLRTARDGEEAYEDLDEEDEASDHDDDDDEDDGGEANDDQEDM